MAVMEQFSVFDPETENWESYYTRFQFYLQMNGVTDPVMKRAMFFSFCGRKTFNVAQTILAPEQIAETAFDTIMNCLKDHFSLQLSKITCHHAFYMRAQGLGEPVTGFITPFNFTELENML